MWRFLRALSAKTLPPGNIRRVRLKNPRPSQFISAAMPGLLLTQPGVAAISSDVDPVYTVYHMQFTTDLSDD